MGLTSHLEELGTTPLGMGYIAREGARKAKSALCPVKGWDVMLEVMGIC